MFSMLINSVKSFLGVQEEEVNMDDLISRFNNATSSLEQSETKEDNADASGCFHRTGTITSMTSEDVLIDDMYLCELANSSISNLEVGLKVSYLAYQKTKNDELKIRKILAVHNAWNNFIENQGPIHNQMMKKLLVSKVMRREGRFLFLEPMNFGIDLDTVDSTFVPYVGDWIKVESLVEVDESATDLGGTVLEVDRIQPLRSNLRTGRVNEYDGRTGVGVIEGKIVFSKLALQPGYSPSAGDEVVCDCIESDQGIYTWRCLSVVPLMQVNNNNNVNSDQSKNSREDVLELLKNKNGIFVSDDLNFNLEFGEEKVLDVIVRNSGNREQTFLKGIFISKKAQSQLSLLSPRIDEVLTLKPSESMKFNFKCRAKFIGSTEELFIFSFRNFKIGRNLKINVNPKDFGRQTEIIHGSRRDKLARHDIYDQENYIPGIRPCKPPNFITVRNSVFRVPDKLWRLALEITNEKMSQSEGEVLLGEEIPHLIHGLTPENYVDRFHTLLYLEEISLTIDMQRYDMDSAFLRPFEDCLALTVPGLVEKRPSLIVGDRAVVSFRWDSSGGNFKYEGCIHKITSNEVFMKFNQKFQDNYNGEDCQVTFKSSYSTISRCHNAVNLAMARLTREILFPTRVKEKDPQVICEAIEIAGSNQQKKDIMKPMSIEAKIRQRKLTWFNKNLNVHQKRAVKNILHGVARPLPYVIFGPPGTGKTITLCETILQILTTIPESRLLIATPSNSSANLIAERLLESGVLKPGEMVRLIAHHCLQDDSVPEKLLPYCATGDLAAENSSRKFEHNGDGPRINCTTSVLGRHRITIGTCIALGLLHNMGFPRGHFSHILIDEAGQATEPEILVPLSFIHASQGQIILAGDPMQLGPVVNSRLASAFGLGESFLVRLLHQFPYQRDPEGFKEGYDPRLVTKLVINYRSLPEILEVSNSLFYDSELIPQISAVSLEAALLKSLAEILPSRDEGPPAIVFHGVNGENKQDPDSPSWYNLAEATQVYLYLLELYNHGLSDKDVGIITPYQKQVRQIRDLLMELDIPLPKVGSVEEFQGQERKIIILSAVRSTQDYIGEDIKHALGFIASPRRLNVALTRARALLIILGNPQLLKHDPYWRSVLMYCIKNQSYTGCNFETDEFNENIKMMLEIEDSDDIIELSEN